MSKHRLALSLLLACAACNGGASKRTRVDHAWVRLPAVPDHPGAAYLTVTAGAKPVRLLAVDSPAAGSSELHRSMATAGVGGMATMSMAPVDGIDVPAGGAVSLSPGGYHVMLFGLDRRLNPGATVPLTVRLAGVPPIAIEAKAVGAGDPAPS